MTCSGFGTFYWTSWTLNRWYSHTSRRGPLAKRPCCPVMGPDVCMSIRVCVLYVWNSDFEPPLYMTHSSVLAVQTGIEKVATVLSPAGPPAAPPQRNAVSSLISVCRPLAPAWSHRGLRFPQGLGPSCSHPSTAHGLAPLVPMYGVLHHWHRHPPFWVMTQPRESVWGGGGVREGGRGERRGCPVCTEHRQTAGNSCSVRFE